MSSRANPEQSEREVEEPALSKVEWTCGSLPFPLSPLPFNQMAPLTEPDILAALRDVYDPELPVNIVDLGLIYRIDLTPDPDAPGMLPRQKVEIDVTMTSQGCPAHEVILEKIKNRLAGLQQISQTVVNLTWEPPWTPQRITPTARKQLGIE
jgi:metal-sulfur cluster biosynthetic enzyme